MSDRTPPSAGSTGSQELGPKRFELPHPAVRWWADASTVLFLLMGLVLAFSVDFLLPDVRDLPFVRDNLPIADSELHGNHIRLTLITKAAVVIGALVAITWLVWQFLAHVNARALSGRKGRLMPALGLIAWLVPGVNLIAPPLVIRRLLRASDPDVVNSEEKSLGRSSFLVWLWWAGWLAGWTLLYIAFRPVIEGDPTPSELITRDHFAIAASLVAIPTALFAAILIHQVNARQLLKEDRLEFRDWVGWSKSA
jgi:hypothetical protein